MNPSFIKKNIFMLKCIKCNSDLELKNNSIICKTCGEVYKIKQGIPILLPRSIPREKNREIELFLRIIKIILKKNNISKITEKEILKYPTSLNFKHNFLPFIKKKTKILEIGCGALAVSRICHDNETFFTDLSWDLLKYANVDNCFCCDINNLPFKDEVFDCVIGSAVLHHLIDINQGLSEIRRVLKNSGFYLGMNEPIANPAILPFYKFFNPYCKIAIDRGSIENIYTLQEMTQFFKKAEFDINIKLCKNPLYQLLSVFPMRLFHILIRFLPDFLVKSIGGNINIYAKKDKSA
jgi:SAM-dependent methyltransferase